MWYENGRRRQCEAVTEEKLAARLEKVTERLAADAPNMERPGAALIAYYLSPDRLPADEPWSRKHADTQRRLCERYLAPVIGRPGLPGHQDRPHAGRRSTPRPPRGKATRLRRCISALVGAGITGGYLANPRLQGVHWQAGDRPRPPPAASIAGESALFVDPAEIPAARRRRQARPGPGRPARRAV